MQVDDQVLQLAHDRAVKALFDPRTPKWVEDYYSVESNYAGSLFLEIEPRDPYRITAADLFAVTTLNVDVPARAARRFLFDPIIAKALGDSLSSLPATTLGRATDEDFRSMATFYELVKSSLARHGVVQSNPWVTASKLAARKRPELFPVRDAKVTELLGIKRLADYRIDWRVFSFLMKQSGVLEGLDTLAQHLAKCPRDEVRADNEPLRVLDVVLWKFAVSRDASPTSTTTT